MAELAAPPIAGVVAEDRIAVATQWQLIWWRFRKHKLAVGGTIVLLLGVMTVIGTFISDLLLMWIDPRIRLGRE